MKKFQIKIGEFNKQMTEEELRQRFEKFLDDPLLYGMTFNVKCTEVDGMFAAQN